MKFIKLITAFLVMLLMTVSLEAQIFQTFGAASYSQDTGTDSASFKRNYYFLIPEGMKIDTTMQLNYYQNSVDGTPVISISYKFGLNFGGNLTTETHLSADSNLVDASYEVEGNSNWQIYPHADDDLENAAYTSAAYNVLLVTIAGAALNESDTEFGFIVRGVPLYENTKYKLKEAKILY